MDWFHSGQFGAACLTHKQLTGLQYALIFLPGLIVGRIFDMGWTKTPLGVASAVIVAVTFLTAECTKYWQFFLCQGVALGVSIQCPMPLPAPTNGMYLASLWCHFRRCDGLSCPLVQT